MATLMYKNNSLSGVSLGLAKEFNSTNSEFKVPTAKLLDILKREVDEKGSTTIKFFDTIEDVQTAIANGTINNGEFYMTRQ